MNKALLGTLFLLMPIDAFAPGAALLREFGGRPFNFALSIMIICSVALVPAKWIEFKWRRFEFFSLFAIFVGFGISTIFFIVNQVHESSVMDMQRSPLYSFLSQSFVLGASIVFIFFLRGFFDGVGPALLDLIAPVCLWVSIFHLFFFGVHALSITGYELSPVMGLMNWIRPDAGAMRAHGLMSEPSYWGAFVAYAWPILVFSFRGERIRVVSKFVAALLIGTAIMIGARTLIGIIFIQVLIVVFASRLSNGIKLILLFVSAFVGAAVLILSTDIFAVSENLSSAMRLGSTLLGLNVASVYGLAGVGVGQFHYYFKPEFAPDFLFLSAEAAHIFDDLSDFRASTFNFYVRLIVELGTIGFLGYLCLIVRAALNLFRLVEKGQRTGLGLAFVGALSFWLTQDSFLYSPALLFIALGLSLANVGRGAECMPESAKFGRKV